MKASELRIGNWLNWYSTYHCNGYFDKQLEIDDFTQTDLSSAKPIPLTEDWLLKFGFNKDYKNGWIGIDVKRESGMTTDFVLAEPLNMAEWQKYYAFVYDSYRFTKLEYVHQLQNLYFALTGKELEITE